MFLTRQRRSSFSCAAVILLAIFSLTFTLATRYSTAEGPTHTVAAVKTQPQSAKTQHRVRDAAEWQAPASTFAIFVASRAPLRAQRPVKLHTTMDAVESLYNRPPPSLLTISS